MGNGASRSRVLVVATCPDVLRRTRRLLMAEGYDVTACDTTDAAMAQVKSQPFGVVAIVTDESDREADPLLAVLGERDEVELVVVSPARLSCSGDATSDLAMEAAGDSRLGSTPPPEMSLIPWAVLARVGEAQWKRYARNLERAVAEHATALREERERFQQLAGHIHHVFWVTSADRQKLLYVNPAYETVWGKSCASLYAQPMSFLAAVHPDDRGRLLSAWSHSGEVALNEEFRIVRDDGGLRWVHSRGIPVFDERGALVRLAVLSEDVTERKRIEDLVRKTEQHHRHASKLEALGTLAGGIAHDFNNILTAILGYTELALATVPKESRARRNLQEVLTAGHRAEHLIQQILTFSRQGGGERTLVRLESILREAFTLLRATIPTTIDIRVHLLSEATVSADPSQMHQVIVNLCANAEYAMREQGGTLDITLEDVHVTENDREWSTLRPGPYVRLTVTDTGQGMAPDLLERMFDPFFTTKRIGEGSGMGLAVVHGIVTGHGGAIRAESTPGIGTTVMVYLPAVQTTQPREAMSPDRAPVGKESILFVDDEEALVRLGQELLSSLGYRVEVRTNSLEALELFRANPERFDLVITDQTMPMMTGEHFARELLKLRPDLPIILCTGFSHTMTADRAKALGIRAYLMKPLAIRDLAPIVRHVLDEEPIILSRNPGT